jgi:hypothetical protein
MDFKPYTEFVLPPEKGTGIRRGKSRPQPRQGVSEPRKVKRTAETIVTDIESPVDSTLEPRAHVLKGSRKPAVATTAPAAPKAEPSDLAERDPPAENASPPAAEADAAGPAPSPAAGAPGCIGVTHRDYLIAYGGRFIGHYRSPRRITDRTAFRHVAQRLAEGIDGFDPQLLEVFKPLPLNVEDRSLDAGEVESFYWFG